MNNRLRSLALVPAGALVAALLLTGCGRQGPLVSDYWSSDGASAGSSPSGSPSEGASSPHADLWGDYVGAAPAFAPFKGEGEIAFSLGADSVAFRANCNPHTGSPEWVGDNLRVRSVASGKMACPDQAATNQDKWLKRFFNRPLILTPTEAGVTISDGHSELELTRTAPDSAAHAIGEHEWRLVRAGSAATPQDVADLEVTLQVEGDRMVFGDGCNTGGASVVVTEDTLQVSDAMSTMMACEGEPVEMLQATVREVLASGEVSWSIEGDTLRLERDGKVLEYQQA